MHLDSFQNILEQSVPDKNFNGVGIIDFESWKPVLRQNFGVLTPYKDVSYEIEKKRHWWWKKQWIQEEAKRRFEGAGREFMQATVSLAKQMRPHAVWGYYGFPYCYNMANNNRKEACADNVPQENDGISWLWQESTALFPSVYSSDDMSAAQLAALVRGRVREAARLAAPAAPVLPYFWYRYRDKGFFKESDLHVAFSTFYKSNASGFIIWGSSNDVNTIDKCKNLKQYVTDTLGPAVAKYAKRNMRLGDDSDESFTGTYNANNASKYDPEFTWIPPVNYTQKIEEMVDKELKEEEEAALTHKKINESILVDMILHKIANYCVEGCDNKSKVSQTDKKEGDGSINESRVVLVTEDPFKKNSSGIAVTVPTTTEEDVYDYDLNAADDTEEENYDTNEYIAISTTSKGIEKTSTTMKTIDDISKTSTTAKEISFLDVNEEENNKINENSSTVYMSTESDGSSNVSQQETSTIAIKTTEAEENNNNRLIIQDINAVDLSTEETNSTDESSIPTLSTTELIINKLSTTESTTSSPEETSIIKNDLSINENRTESNLIEIDFIDVSTKDSSTINTRTDDDGTTDSVSAIVEPSSFDTGSTEEPSEVDASTAQPSADNRTSVDNKSDSSTTMAPVFTEQVVVSVV